MPDVVGIAPDPAAIKLRLTGMYVEQVRDAAEGEDAIERWLEEKGVALLVVGEMLLDGFSPAFRERLRRHKGRPLIVYCPVFETETINVDEYLSAVIKPAVGFEIRLD
jgi:hypothetical protein